MFEATPFRWARRTAFRFKVVKFFWYAFRRHLSPKTTLMAQRHSLVRSRVWGNGRSAASSRAPKIIWTFWEGDKSRCGEACQGSWKAHQADFAINILTPESLRKFLPDFPSISDGIPVQLKSDLVRLMLLERYGGVWIDYSTVLTEPVNWAVDMLNQSDQELLAFYNEFPGSYRVNQERPIIENGFLVAKQGSNFISDWRRAHQACILSNDYLTFYSAKDHYDQIRSNFITRDEGMVGYLACYLAAQEVMLGSSGYNLFLMDATDDYYFYYYGTKPPRSRWRFAEELLLRSRGQTNPPRLVKITSGHRSAIDEYLRYGCYRETSLLGQYVH